MANYKVVDAGKLDADLTSVADAIRERSGTTEPLSFPADFKTAVAAIPDLMYRKIMGQTFSYSNDAEIESTADYAFFRFHSMVSLSLPNCKALGWQACVQCTTLKEVFLPRVTSCGSMSFSNCTALEKLDFPSVTDIYTQTFNACSKLKYLCLRHTGKVVSLGNINNFTGTPFASGGSGGKLLVPLALVESYKTSTNWSAIWGYGTNKFLALEDYTVDGTITGEIDWDAVAAA